MASPRPQPAALSNSLRLGFLLLLGLAVGCHSDLEEIRAIQAQREARLQTQANQDHLAEMYSLVERLIELNPEKARQQITYHLNQWNQAQGHGEEPDPTPQLLSTLSDVLPEEQIRQQVSRPTFVRSDVNHLRDAYLLSQIVRWVDLPQHDDPVLEEWFAERLGGEQGERYAELQTATRLFDWTIRNIALQPSEMPVPDAIPRPNLPLGMRIEGPGYRQTDYQTLFRGVGDGLQRAGVFIQLCRQADIDAAVLATQSTDTGELTPWAVGVLIGEEVYLFEPELGCFVPGPDQQGIATLREARRDESVMRRLNIPGFFDYPLSRQDVQQSIALLNVTPEAVSPRMRQLERSLTGNRRMTLYVDPDQLAERLDAVPGIAGVRMWKIPLLAEVYQAAMEEAAARDPLLGFWFFSRWAILESEVEMSKLLAQGRWRHLQGRFSDKEMENEPGARSLYLQQRAPEFEIADLRIDVELQKQYGIRRELGMAPQEYDRQIQQVQGLMRLGKRTATYWLSLLQYDDGRYETAENWFSKRALDEDQPSHWQPAARYNLGRTVEHLGELERAVALYKTDGDPQEHGNRLRARLIDPPREGG